MDFLLKTTTNGIVIGLMYALMGLGLAFIYSIMRTMNFAHGEFYTASAFISYWIGESLGLSAIEAFPIALAGAAILGWVIVRLILWPVTQGKVERPGEYTLITTLALMLLLQKFFLLIFGPFGHQPPSFIGGIYVSFGIFEIPGERVAAGVGALVALVALYMFVRYTWLGRQFVATSQNRIGAEVIGIDTARMSTVAFIVGALLAGVAGVLLSPIYSVYPTAGVIPVVKGFIVITLAGLGSIIGTIIAGILLGVVELLGSVYLDAGYRDTYAFLFLILILLIRPNGLFGENERLA
jgi:branched-chain amino acid transport system permease protein